MDLLELLLLEVEGKWALTSPAGDLLTMLSLLYWGQLHGGTGLKKGYTEDKLQIWSAAY